MSDNYFVKDSVIAETSSIHDNATVIHSHLQGNNFIGKFSTLTYSKLGNYSYISQFSVVKSTQIGKFTSISWGCSIGPEDHDFNRLSTHSFLISNETFKLIEKKIYSPFEKECIIGSDVWIGCNSTVLRGVKIGDGAVIGANSLVKNDVPPYAVVVGSPAKIIKYRFPENIIQELMEIQWWNFSDIQIKKILHLFTKDEIDLDTIIELKKIRDEEF